MMIALPDLVLDRIVTDIAVLAATILLLKQWVRSDIAKLTEMLSNYREEHQAFRAKTEEDMEDMETRLDTAIRDLAKSVEEFVRRSTDDKLRFRDEAVTRDNLLQVKVASLDVTVNRLERTVDKFENSLSEFTKNTPKK